MVPEHPLPANSNADGVDTFPGVGIPVDPTPSLSGFDGQRANGSWRLFVVDDSGADCDQFGGGWSIKLTATQ